MAVHMEERGAEVVARAAAAAILQVQDEVLDLFAGRGRTGAIARLRARSRELSISGVAFDQIKSMALERAADDVSWGRPPLASWSIFLDEDGRPSPAERLALRLQVGPPDPADDKAARELRRAVEARILGEEQDAFTAARRLPQLLRREGLLQDALWDDPRLAASPPIRRLMRAVGAQLQQKLAPSPAVAGPGWAAAAPEHRGLWSRLFGRACAGWR